MSRQIFPHAKLHPALRPVQEFFINKEWYSLYDVKGRILGVEYSVYKNGEPNPIQHNMSITEVLNQLSQLLLKENQPRRLSTDRYLPDVISQLLEIIPQEEQWQFDLRQELESVRLTAATKAPEVMLYQWNAAHAALERYTLEVLPVNRDLWPDWCKKMLNIWTDKEAR